MSDYTRTILVTGSNSGIGYELVRLLARKGHNVYLASRNEKSGQDAQEKLKAEGLSVKLVQLEVTDITSVEAAKDVIEKAEGKLDVLVNNAGISKMGTPQSALDVDLATIREAFEPNFYGMIQTTQTFLPLLRKAKPGYGVILEVSTDMASNGLMASGKMPDFLHLIAYNSSKAAANSYIISLAHELKKEKEKIKVNTVTPGFTTTKLNHHSPGGKTPEKAAEMLAEWALLGPADEAKTGLFYDDAGPLLW